MTFNPKWIKSTEVVKRDGSNSLTNDWNIGDKKKIILDELRIQDSDGFIISDTTGNILFFIDELSKTIKFNKGIGVDEISNNSITDSNSSILTASAIHALHNINKNGRFSLSNGNIIATITFDSAESDVNYKVFTQLINEIDSPISLYSIIVTEKTINDFSVEFSGDIDSDNYILEWFITR